MGIALIIIFFIALALYVCFYVFPSLIIGICQLIIATFKALITVIIGTYSFLINIFGELYCKEKSKKEKEYIDNKVKEADIRDMNEHRDRMIAKMQAINLEASTKADTFRAKYPLADEQLIKDFVRVYPEASVNELQRYEENIKKSHEAGMVHNNMMRTGERRHFTLSDLSGLKPELEQNEYPLMLKVFYVDSNFVLVVKNQNTNGTKMYQSFDQTKILAKLNEVIAKQKMLKANNQNVMSETF
jgi:hypothetical protein